MIKVLINVLSKVLIIVLISNADNCADHSDLITRAFIHCTENYNKNLLLKNDRKTDSFAANLFGLLLL